jgi:hypothetical protein
MSLVDGESLDPEPAEDLSLIARLEAMRIVGATHLAVPTDERRWVSEHTEFLNHVSGRYGVLHTGPPTQVFDLRTSMYAPDVLARTGALSRDGSGSAFIVTRAETNELLAAFTRRVSAPLSVLDALGIVDPTSSRDLLVIRPSTARNGDLPWADRSFDIACIPQALSHRRTIARVATVEPSHEDEAHGELVVKLEAGWSARARPPSRWSIIRVGSHRSPRSDEVTREAVARDTLQVSGLEHERIVDVADEPDFVALMEPSVILLPGGTQLIESAFATMPRVGAVAVKVLTASGGLESAGVALFSDGTMAPLAGDSRDVRAPWHDYARDCCWGTGILAIRAPLVDSLDLRFSSEVNEPLSTAAARLWASGWHVLYQPGVVAVRVDSMQGPSHGRTPAPDAWQVAMKKQPPAPERLDWRAWRRVLMSQESDGIWR